MMSHLYPVPPLSWSLGNTADLLTIFLHDGFIFLTLPLSPQLFRNDL